MKRLAFVLLLAPALVGFRPQEERCAPPDREPAWFLVKLGRSTPMTAEICPCCDRPMTPAMKPRAPAPPPPPAYGRSTEPEWFRTKLGR